MLEATVWQEVRSFVDHPEEHIAEAQRQLRERLADASRTDEQRKTLARELAGKEQERERVLDLFRRGRITAAECDRDLDKVAGEAREIREMLDALRARAEMAAGSEAYLSDVGAALAQMQGRVEEIERANDWPAMRQLIELLAPSLVLQTEILGLGKVRLRKRASLRLTLAYRSKTAVVSLTNWPGARRSKPPGSSCPSGGFTGGSG